MTAWVNRLTELASDDPRHGTDNGYTNHHCRCEPCRVAANTERAKRYHNRRTW